MRKVEQCMCLGLLLVLTGTVTAVWASQSQDTSTCILYSVVCVWSMLLGLLLLDICSWSPADSHSWFTLILQYLLMRILVAIGSWVYSSFRNDALRATTVQTKLLRDILDHNKHTTYGVDFTFSNIKTREEFVVKHPLTRYGHYSEYIEAIKAGHQRVLTADPVVYLATSSGTTGRSKIIPITGHMKRSFGPKLGAMMYYIRQQKAGLCLRRVFILSYAVPAVKSQGDLDMGPVTNHMGRVIPFAISPKECFDITDEQTAVHVHAVFALREPDIGHIEVIMSPLMYSFWQYLHVHWESVCSDIATGTLSAAVPLPTSIRKALQRQLTPHPARARQLRSFFRLGFRGVATRIWPNLRFVSMLATGSFAHYAKLLRMREMSGVVQVSTLHVASEGFMGVNMSPVTTDFSYTAMFNYGFMEFIREENIDEEQPDTYFCEQLKVGEPYEIVLTTPMGLYRYRTGDVVRVRNMVGQCPVYEFMHRVGQALNVYWEKTSESALYEAVDRATNALPDVCLADYTATENSHLPDDSTDQSRNTKHYVLFVETLGKDRNEHRVLTDTDTEQFDVSLSSVSDMYKTMRHNGSIGRMRVVQVEPGTFDVMKSGMTARAQTQQFKMPRVIRDKAQLQCLLDRQVSSSV